MPLPPRERPLDPAVEGIEDWPGKRKQQAEREFVSGELARKLAIDRDVRIREYRAAGNESAARALEQGADKVAEWARRVIEDWRQRPDKNCIEVGAIGGCRIDVCATANPSVEVRLQCR
jgi:hypothetical protein